MTSRFGKPQASGAGTAKACSLDEIKTEVWEELKKSLNVGGKTILKDENLHSWFLDPDIVIFDDPTNPEPTKKTNREPLLVNYINTWDLRPDAHMRIPNLFLASDYVRTYTDLATMEAANEAARRAVNCIIDAADAKASYCQLWQLHEPFVLAPWRSHDLTRYQRRLPWNGRML